MKILNIHEKKLHSAVCFHFGFSLFAFAELWSRCAWSSLAEEKAAKAEREEEGGGGDIGSERGRK